jgi:hypothetical protein
MTKRKKTDIVGLKLRLRESLRARIEAAAKAQERSLNNEVIARLEQSFDRESLTRLRDNVEKGLDAIMVQNERREKLLELESQKFRRALEEYYGRMTSAADHRIKLAAAAARDGDTQDDLPQESKGGKS